MSGYYMLIGKLYFEGSVGQRLNYRTLKFNNIILWQNNPSSATNFVTYQLLSTRVVIITPSEVSATVFS